MTALIESETRAPGLPAPTVAPLPAGVEAAAAIYIALTKPVHPGYLRTLLGLAHALGMEAGIDAVRRAREGQP